MTVSTHNPINIGLTLVGWLCLCVLFVALRFDSSERVYFAVDDQVVLWLADDIIATGNWQPDWNRVSGKRHASEYFENESRRTDLAHDHHYNFAGHILLSAAAIKALRQAGVTMPTIVLLHHIAFFWDTLSWLLLISAAWRLGGLGLAMSSALIYCLFPLAVQGSHYARPDAFLTCMGTASLWLALRAQDWSLQHSRWLLANGVVLAAAIAGKASQLMLGIFPALAVSQHFLLDHQQRNWRSAGKILADGIMLLAIAGLFLTAIFFAADISVKDFWISLLSIQLYYQQPGPPDLLEHYSFTTQLFNILQYFYATLGWPLLAAMMIGAITLARRTDKLPFLLLTVPLALFTLYFSSVQAFFDRSFCPLAAAIVLLCAVGILAIVDKVQTAISAIFPPLLLAMLLVALACYKPALINYHLQTDLLRNHHNDSRLAFQQQLKQQWSEKTGTDFWLKNIDKSDMFSQTLPDKPAKNPRIYVVEDLKDWSSRKYLQKLTENAYVQIAEFRGGFYDLPTSSLITVHEAARFVYFVRQDDMPVPITDEKTTQ